MPTSRALEEIKYLEALEPAGVADDWDSTEEFIPSIDDPPIRQVSYSSRGPRDVVVSGPIAEDGWGPGEHYKGRRAAYLAMVKKYGQERVERVRGKQRGRWAYLIKNLKAA